MSWKTGIFVSGQADPSFNGLRFATEEEALEYGDVLWSRWTQAKSYTAVESDDPVQHVFKDGAVEYLS